MVLPVRVCPSPRPNPDAPTHDTHSPTPILAMTLRYTLLSAFNIVSACRSDPASREYCDGEFGPLQPFSAGNLMTVENIAIYCGI